MKKKQKNFLPPIKRNVSEYAESISCADFDAAAFIDYFESVGWVVGGGKKMKDWKAAVRNWIRRNKTEPKPSEMIL